MTWAIAAEVDWYWYAGAVVTAAGVVEYWSAPIGHNDKGAELCIGSQGFCGVNSHTNLQ